MSGARPTAVDAPPTGRDAGTAVERAYRQLKRDIMEAVLAPGRQYLEADLAARLGLSRTPVREACIRLEAEGLIDVVPRRGIRVVAISAEDMAEIYDLLATVEARAAALAAERVSAGRGPHEAVEEMDRAVVAMAAVVDGDDLDSWAREDAAFHRALVLASGNRHLAETAGRYADLVHRARLVTLRLRPRPRDSVADHRELVEAIRAGDGAAASDLHLAHRRRAAATLVPLLEIFDPAGM